MMIMSVMPNLYTADVERAAAFYRDLLGGTQTFRSPGDGPAEHVELRLGDVTIALSSRDAVPEEGLPAPTAGHPMELVVWCESADDAVAALHAAGTPVLVQPYHGHAHRRAYVADPDGNWIALVSKHNG
jgi:lactoylglutathione lyase